MKADRLYRKAMLPLALGALIVVSSPAAAQPANQGTPRPTILRPPSADGETANPPKYRMYLTVLTIGVLMLGANAIPSKRGHQD